MCTNSGTFNKSCFLLLFFLFLFLLLLFFLKRYYFFLRCFDWFRFWRGFDMSFGFRKSFNNWFWLRLWFHNNTFCLW
ncbi:hypothetical protein E4H12_10065 [Candidatus Thorarchaeota archaeon]|nr:MAG: hypothetical protein E4H12_10065 [Candidatus Thorarchaeota archaeon]